MVDYNKIIMDLFERSVKYDNFFLKDLRFLKTKLNLSTTPLVVIGWAWEVYLQEVYLDITQRHTIYTIENIITDDAIKKFTDFLEEWLKNELRYETRCIIK